MSRLNNTLRKNEKAAISKKKKKKTVIPVYNTAGKTITPEKKKRDTRLAVIGGTIAVVMGFIYLPQFFWKEAGESTPKAPITMNSKAVRQANNALRDNPSDDFDGDGIENAEELSLKTNPWEIDTDHDGATDFCEVHITNTNPLQPDEILKDTQTKLDEQKGKKVGSPYKVGDVILWADDYDSKAYGSIVETVNGYQVCGFNGYVQFPNNKGKYAYRVKDGVRTLLDYRKEENVWKVKDGDRIELYPKRLKEIVEMDLFTYPIYLDKNPVTNAIAFLLPDHGFITAAVKMEIDVEPDTRKNVVTEIEKPAFDSADYTRFTMNSNTLNDILFVWEAIDSRSCIAVSLFNEEQGEYLGIIYGYTQSGDLLIADMETLEPIGSIQIREMARKIMDETGTMVSTNYFQFRGLGFDSTKGDRISFFAASSDHIGADRFGNDEENKDANVSEPVNEKKPEDTTAEDTTAEETTTEDKKPDTTQEKTPDIPVPDPNQVDTGDTAVPQP